MSESPARTPGASPGSHAEVTTADRMRRARRVGFATIVIREFSRIMRIWGQTLVPPVITATLYFIIFGNLIGSRIGEMGGFTYLQYIAPGLIMMSVITNSYGNVVSSFFGAKFGRHIEELLVSPLPGVLRGLLVGLIVSVIALFFTHLHVEHPFIVIAAVLLTSVVFALGGFVNAVFAKNFDQITFVPTFILTPMTYLGGVFYSISMLPGWAQTVSMANPILYMVNAFRYGFLGRSDVDVGFSFAIRVRVADESRDGHARVRRPFPCAAASPSTRPTKPSSGCSGCPTTRLPSSRATTSRRRRSFRPCACCPTTPRPTSWRRGDWPSSTGGWCRCGRRKSRLAPA